MRRKTTEENHPRYGFMVVHHNLLSRDLPPQDFELRTSNGSVAQISWCGQRWWVMHGRWTNHGACLKIVQPETGVGVALLAEGNGEYASNQRAPELRWHEGDYRELLSRVHTRIGKADCTGTYPSVLIREESLNGIKDGFAKPPVSRVV